MPGIQEYLPLAQLVANVLALPKTIDDQAQADNAFRQLAQGMPGVSPQQLDAIAPAGQSFAGHDVPVLGSALRGIGTVGQVMQGVLGAPPSAPRPSLQTYLQLQSVAQGQAKANATRDLAATFKKPEAIAAANAGQFDLAYKLEHPESASGRGGFSEGALLSRYYDLQQNDPQNPMLPVLKSTLDAMQQRATARARVAGGIAYGNQAAGRAEANVIRDTDIAEKRARGRQFLQNQGIAPPGGGNIIPQSGAQMRGPNGGFTLIGDMTNAADQSAAKLPTPLRQEGASISSEGEAKISMGLPDKVDTDLGLIASSNNIDLRNPTPQQSEFLLKAQEGLRMARAAAAREAERIPDTDRQQIAGMRTVQYLLQRALTEFSPEERAQYVGIVNNPARRALQFANPDSRFAEWMALVSQIEAAKFDLAGKQLTGIEQDIVNRFIPTSRETGGVTDFDAKANEYLKSSQFRIQERLNLLGGAGQVRERIQQEPIPGAAATDPVAAAKERLRAKGYAVR